MLYVIDSYAYAYFFESIEEIRSLAHLYSIYYARAWLTSMFDAEASLQDLTCIKNLEKVCNEKENDQIGSKP